MIYVFEKRYVWVVLSYKLRNAAKYYLFGNVSQIFSA